MSNSETPTHPNPPIPDHAVPDPNNPNSMIVSGSIAPMHGPTVLRNLASREPRPEPPIHAEAGQVAQAGKARAAAGGNALKLPRFVHAPRTRVYDASQMVVERQTYEDANDAARAIVEWVGDPLDPANTQRLRTMAKVYIDPDSAPDSAKEIALALANELILASHEMPLTMSSCQALTLAYATISRENERRTVNHD